MGEWPCAGDQRRGVDADPAAPQLHRRRGVPLPGAVDWASARLNLALAEGDALYIGAGANLEVQFGARSFVRAGENSQLSLVAQDEHRIQFSVTSGLALFDLRRMDEGDTLEVSTPNAVFLVEHPGYYRVEVGSRDTHFITRRGGEATVTTADGRTLSIYPSEDIVITAGDPVQVATYAAPEPDAWEGCRGGPISPCGGAATGDPALPSAGRPRFPR